MSDRIIADEQIYSLVPTDIDGADALMELALDLRSSWHHGTDTLWERLDADLWRATRNPWVVLQTVSRDRLRDCLADDGFRQDLGRLLHDRRAAVTHAAWFQEQHEASALSGVAYFSLEFMLSEALPIYSGGLGNVAGDQLKAANDLGVPVVGVGLLYQQGYFRQLIGADGTQQAAYPYNDPGQLPVTPLRHANGEWLRLKLDLPGHAIWLRAWQARVGRLKLYLLDTNDAANHPPYRGITSELYGGGPELRLMQEMVLGIGGWRLLNALGLAPEVCHLNEGHAALVVLERARHYMASTGADFDRALTATRAGNLFTTHTAVPAGFDRFDPGLVAHCLGSYAESQLGITPAELLALGRQNGGDDTESFNMAYLAIRGCGAVNGVSQLHGEVSRSLFAPLYPRWPVHEVPVGHVTNGVHTPTWDSAAADTLWTAVCGQARWLGTTEHLGRDICCVSDDELWSFRCAASVTLVDYVSDRLSQQVAAAGTVHSVGPHRPLDPDVLTLGFARRFATYKRPDLLLQDPARLQRLLTDPERPMQLVLAGKAHPADAAGQALIRRWLEFTQRPEVSDRVVFLSDYDMHLAEHLVQGVDVWLNTPRRPWEASGTSGMKVLVNGGINLSELDGWWAEAYTPDVGWALGDGQEHGDDPAWDAAQADALYTLLETEVLPEFYDRDDRGIPSRWVARMRNSMAELTPRFSTNRTVREYTEQYYLPAAAAYRARSADGGQQAAGIADWRRRLVNHWPSLRFGAVVLEPHDESYRAEATVILGELEPGDIDVELFAEASVGRATVCVPMTADDDEPDPTGSRHYTATVPADRPPEAFTVRIVPGREGVSVPLEAAHILWHR